jgi:hypothetical protein
MRPPCELIVREVIPAFRTLVARQLIKKHHFSQIEVAKTLGTTQATVSYYLHSKRGKKGMEHLQSKPLIQSIASEVAERIANKKFSLIDTTLEFCRLCKALKGGELMCDMHKRLVSLPENCDLCAEATHK